MPTPTQLVQIAPVDLGLPEKFAQFRPIQLEAAEFVEVSKKRFVVTNLKVGSGKSLFAAKLAKTIGRTAILTSTKGLASQYMADFEESGLLEVRGKANYTCSQYNNCDIGSHSGCMEGDFCPAKQAYREACSADWIVTNYAYWLNVWNKAGGLVDPELEVPFDCLILDEAHAAAEELSRFLDFEISESDVDAFELPPIKPNGDDLSEWQSWAGCAKEKLSKWQSEAKEGKLKAARQRKHRDLLIERCGLIAGLSLDNWTIEAESHSRFGRQARFNCIWPGQYAEKLFQGIPKIVLMSGTVTPRSLPYIGIKRADADYKEWPYQFPKNRAPFYYVKSGVRVRYEMPDEDWDIMVSLFDDFIRPRISRKGLIHTNSFDQVRKVLSRSEFAFHMRTKFKEDEQTTDELVADHKAATGSSILIHPGISTGYDFPLDAAEWQIILKVPFPPMKSKVMRARRDKDKNYMTASAATKIDQMKGRIVRRPEDRGETVIFDGQWEWFEWAADGYFSNTVKSVWLDKVPPPGKRWNEK